MNNSSSGHKRTGIAYCQLPIEDCRLKYKTKSANLKLKIGNVFTLIELLIVITIISILAAMLLPALKAAKDTAQGTVCKSNLKQMSAAMIMYAEENYGWSPPADYTKTAGNGVVYYDYLYDKSNLVPKIVPGKYNIYCCPSADPPVNYNYIYGARACLYVTTGFKITDPLIYLRNTIPTRSTTWRPDIFIIIGDSQYTTAAVKNSNSSWSVLGDTYSGRPASWGGPCMRHSRKGNFGFVDGHVDAIDGPSLIYNYYGVNSYYFTNYLDSKGNNFGMY